MPYAHYTAEEVAARGEALYEQQIRAQVEAAHQGEFVVVDIETGDYEIAPDDLVATKRALAKRTRCCLVWTARWGSNYLPAWWAFCHTPAMITGRVTALREATIRLTVIGPNQHQQALEAVLDTGFNGLLILSARVVRDTTTNMRPNASSPSVTNRCSPSERSSSRVILLGSYDTASAFGNATP